MYQGDSDLPLGEILIRAEYLATKNEPWTFSIVKNFDACRNLCFDRLHHQRIDRLWSLGTKTVVANYYEKIYFV